MKNEFNNHNEKNHRNEALSLLRKDEKIYILSNLFGKHINKYYKKTNKRSQDRLQYFNFYFSTNTFFQYFYFNT